MLKHVTPNAWSMIELPQNGCLVLWPKQKSQIETLGASLLQSFITFRHYCCLVETDLVHKCFGKMLLPPGKEQDKGPFGRHGTARLLQSSVPLQRLVSNPAELKQYADNRCRTCDLEMPNFDICHVVPKALPLQLHFCILYVSVCTSREGNYK